MLVALKRRFKFEPDERDEDLTERYQRLQCAPKSDNGIDKWLDQWDRFYDDCVEAGHYYTKGNQPAIDFIDAGRELDDAFAAYYFCRLKEEDMDLGKMDVDLHDLVQHYRTWNLLKWDRHKATWNQ